MKYIIIKNTNKLKPKEYNFSDIESSQKNIVNKIFKLLEKYPKKVFSVQDFIKEPPSNWRFHILVFDKVPTKEELNQYKKEEYVSGIHIVPITKSWIKVLQKDIEKYKQTKEQKQNGELLRKLLY